MSYSRRDVLVTTAALSAGSLAGCLDGFGGDTDQWATASFFTLAEFTRAVTGDTRSVDNAVPSGQHGHGWQPSAHMLPTIVESDVFVYLGSEGFQPWVDDAVSQIEHDHADDVVLVDALEGIELLEYGDDHGHEHEDDAHDGHANGPDAESALDVRAIDLLEPASGEVVVDAHGDHWHGVPLEVPTDDSRTLEAAVETADGVVDGSEDAYDLTVRVEDGSSGLAVDGHGDHLHVRGEALETATIVVGLERDGDLVWEAPPLAVRGRDRSAGDDTDYGDSERGHDDDHGHSHDGGGHGHGDDGHDYGHSHDGHGHDHSHGDDGHGHDHSHGEYDAKFFSDPVLAQRGVETIRDALIEIDPGNESVYAENASAYLEELRTLHEAFESALADREHDHVVLAGHDSFQYLGERYGFEIHTPVGLSPDDSPSGREIAAAVEFLEEHGIEYVLWDYFDGEELAAELAAEADTVTDTVMVSPAESVVEEWVEDGYGDYIGQMREINLPAFERALGAP
ncbi:metal ion ABC transporter substrate-binding protein [Salinadaptatus halalkaliphilus]|uniref:Metal ion ABC transporter substrate-binding protein n=1 Tax=Salinadaptatus halalkaliphilus TaxID=2419781 RepID=A0A4S3TPL9_9EURY|nr:zinc ABC transporter substrate-binding protein [Salinadaptatus halalkaliphilus]THE66304.1 metal ion ABC transporter substrate-binding protein [Salinadaptatus halalkaliphilus]